ncbi:CKLF-like MARVEL transmembrane domain-containing protein 6 [Sphaeramia orbicularis]|uniref:MARVEL domain-containing protein n=1 Tax=Sphaeramia orbicularis TaxID=375764 RepID=A0A673ASV0_9TELE|nr:CKLF-like MARVEL transmembrane domain-containing protein 6 [Sphaeramia orbicularis]
MDGVYAQTTTPNPRTSCFQIPLDFLDMKRFGVKIVEVLLSFVAFVTEEMVSSCISCPPLYLFEFVSCTAFLFTLLLLILLASPLHLRVGITCWPMLDFVYTTIIAVLFIIASIVFASSNSGTSLEKAAAVFGFMASVAFVADIFLFFKENGLPFNKMEKQGPTNGIMPPVEAQPEAEKLTATENGQ